MNSFAGHVAKLMSGTAFSHAIYLLLTPVLTRMFLPADFGLLALFTSFCAVAGSVSCLKYDVAILSSKTEEDRDQLVHLCLLIVLPFSLIAGGVAAGLKYGDVLGYGRLEWIGIGLIVPTVTLAGMYQALRYFSLHGGGFGRIARQTVFQSAGRGISQLGFGWAGFGWIGLAFGEFLGWLVAVISLKKMSRFRLSVQSFSFSGLKTQAKKYREFPLLSVPSSLLDTVAVAVQAPMILDLFGPAMGGQFALFLRVVNAPIGLIGAAVGDVFHQKMAALKNTRPQACLGVFFKTAAALAAIGTCGYSILVFWGPDLFAWAFGDEWRTAGELSKLVAPWAISVFTVSPLSRLVFVFHGQRLKLFFDVISIVLIVTVYATAKLQGLDIFAMVRILTWANFANYLIYFLLLWRVLGRGAVKALT